MTTCAASTTVCAAGRCTRGSVTGTFNLQITTIQNLYSLHILQNWKNLSYEFESRSWQGLLDTILCDKVLSVTFDSSVVFSRCHTPIKLTVIIELLLKVALNTINQTKTKDTQKCKVKYNKCTCISYKKKVTCEPDLNKQYENKKI